MDNIKQCYELTKKYCESVHDTINADFYRASALLVARDIWREKHEKCSDTITCTIFYIFISAIELGKSLTEIERILKEYGTL